MTNIAYCCITTLLLYLLQIPCLLSCHSMATSSVLALPLVTSVHLQCGIPAQAERTGPAAGKNHGTSILESHVVYSWAPASCTWAQLNGLEVDDTQTKHDCDVNESLGWLILHVRLTGPQGAQTFGQILFGVCLCFQVILTFDLVG